MGILSRKSKKNESGRSQLFLKINASRAADLAPSHGSDPNESTTTLPSTPSKKSVNPVLLATLNNTKKKTTRKLHTSQPSWDDALLLPLTMNDYTQILVLTIWDKHRRYKNYLGELRLSVSDIFASKSSAEGDSASNGQIVRTQSDLKWYKLYSGKSHRGFVTGSILLSFEIVVKKRRTRHNSNPKPYRNSSKSADIDKTEASVPSVVVKAPTAANDIFTKFDSMKVTEDDDVYDLVPVDTIGEDDKIKLLQEWIDSLIVPGPDPKYTKPDEQGFYLDEEFSTMADVSDLESMTPSILTSSGIDSQGIVGTATESSGFPLTKNSLYLTSQTSTNSLLPASASAVDEELTSGSDFSFLSEGSLEDDEDETGETGSISLNSQEARGSAPTSDSSKHSQKHIPATNGNSSAKTRRSRLRRKKKLMKLSHFEVSNRNVLGVMFLEIISCSDLPPMKNVTRTSFDMDPFVVVTFGKRTFRTSWKRHTLNPIFNERLAFEVLSHEKNFDIQFAVLDKDHFSFHDKVANISLRMKELTDTPEHPAGNNEESQKEEKLPGASAANASEFSLGTPASDNNGDSVSNASPSHIKISEDPNMISSIKKKRFSKRKKITVSYADTSRFKTVDLALSLHNPKYEGKFAPSLKIRARFEPYDSLRRQFWKVLLEQYHLNDAHDRYDYIELIALLDTLGCQDSDEIVNVFFEDHNKSAWGGDTLTHDEISDSLEKYIGSSKAGKIFEIEKCPICSQKRFTKKEDIDIITHVAICASKDWSIVNRLLLSTYDSPQVATRRWFSKALIKLSYGKYKLGSNSANILVQDRMTGIIMEEKMGVYVRLGIRLLYKGLDSAKKRRIRQLLKKLSVKQGSKFDRPSSSGDIASFIKFHKLDLSECLETDPTKYATFNDFFYRKLKPDARPIASPKEERVVVSPADCRCTAFNNVNDATEFWIKGRNFTLSKLFNGNFSSLEDTDLYKPANCSLGIFRLAPQDYHRFHSPVKGTIKSIKHIDGEYYTVNPMAIRSQLDVFGENIRTLIAIETEHFGTVIMVAVGAMMVGSTVLTIAEGDKINRGDEVGYFKFGGSTILLLFQSKYFTFDSDIVNNAHSCVETLIRVGHSVGHSNEIEECSIDHIDFNKQSKNFKLNLIRVLTGGDLNDAKELSNWEATKLEIDADDELVNDELYDSVLDSETDLDEKIKLR